MGFRGLGFRDFGAKGIIGFRELWGLGFRLMDSRFGTWT